MTYILKQNPEWTNELLLGRAAEHDLTPDDLSKITTAAQSNPDIACFMSAVLPKSPVSEILVGQYDIATSLTKLGLYNIAEIVGEKNYHTYIGKLANGKIVACAIESDDQLTADSYTILAIGLFTAEDISDVLVSDDELDMASLDVDLLKEKLDAGEIPDKTPSASDEAYFNNVLKEKTMTHFDPSIPPEMQAIIRKSLNIPEPTQEELDAQAAAGTPEIPPELQAQLDAAKSTFESGDNSAADDEFTEVIG